jgi:hypothetical protein
MAAVVLDGSWSGQNYAPPTPLDITTIETAIVERLIAQITTIEVAHFPDKPEFYRMTHRVGAALVRYDGADYGKLVDTAAIVQERTLKFEITLMMRDLGWGFGGGADGTSPGAYTLIETVRAALTGYQVPGCGKAYPVLERFVERDKQGGVWIYAISFALKTAAVEPSTPDGFPLLILATAQEKGGVTTVSIGATQYTFDQLGTIALPNGNVTAIIVANISTGTPYVSGTDYSIDTVNGLTAGGAIPPQAEVNVAYSYAEIVTAGAGGGDAPLAPRN